MEPDPGMIDWQPPRRITSRKSLIAAGLLVAAILLVAFGAQGVIAIVRACA